MRSKWDSYCKTCGNNWKEGDEVVGVKVGDKWVVCTDKSCVEQTAGKAPPVQQKKLDMSTSTKMSVHEMHTKYLQSFNDDEIIRAEQMVATGMASAKALVGIYIGVRKQCEAYGITEPPVVGMIFNAVVRKKFGGGNSEDD